MDPCGVEAWGATSPSGSSRARFRWTLVGLKQEMGYDVGAEVASFRWTLVGLKHRRRGRSRGGRRVSDGPLWG